MALDPRRRQKKLERKKAKDKNRKLENQRRDKLAAARETALIAVSPIYACRIQNCLETEGIAQAVLARELPDHRLATAILLVDSYCLGIKDAFYKILTRGEYQEIMDGLENSGSTRALDPAAFKLLIDDAIAYARRLGFEPHRDYFKGDFLFQAIDTSQCQERFTFGSEGQPLYICGPHDNAERQRQILATLRRTCGDGNFHYLTQVGHTKLERSRLRNSFDGDEAEEYLDDVLGDETYDDDLDEEDQAQDDEVIDAQFSDRKRE